MATDTAAARHRFRVATELEKHEIRKVRAYNLDLPPTIRINLQYHLPGTWHAIRTEGSLFHGRLRKYCLPGSKETVFQVERYAKLTRYPVHNSPKIILRMAIH